MMETWFYVLIAMQDGKYLKKGQEIISNNAQYSEKDCAESARLVAQGLFIKEGTQYGFRCERVTYEPPRLPAIGAKP